MFDVGTEKRETTMNRTTMGDQVRKAIVDLEQKGARPASFEAVYDLCQGRKVAADKRQIRNVLWHWNKAKYAKTKAKAKIRAIPLPPAAKVKVAKTATKGKTAKRGVPSNGGMPTFVAAHEKLSALVLFLGFDAAQRILDTIKSEILQSFRS